MTKSEFLTALDKKLAALSAEDRSSFLTYYAEIIDDRMEDGLAEADAVAAAGSIDEIAAQLLAETPRTESRLRVRPQKIAAADSFLLLTDPFDAIEIAATCADVELLPAKDGVCRIEFQNEYRCTALVENGVLRITEARRHRVGLTLDLNIGGRQLLDVPMRDNALRLYLPAVTYRLLDAQTRSGDLEVSAGLFFTRVLLRSASGEVAFRAAVASELRIHTASGDIEVQSSTPEQLRLESASGDVEFSGCGKSSVTVRTSSGDVEFADCDEAALDIRTASGDIDGHFSIPRTVSASSVSGDIDVPRTGSGAPCTLHTVSGDISVRIK